ncbi:MAG: hypothetical protein ACLSAF_10905 [Intestinimonas sp.]
MKRIFSVFLSLALAVSLFPAALAEESAGMDRGALAQRLAELCGYADELEGYAAQPSAFSDVAEEDECRAAVNLLRDKGLDAGRRFRRFPPFRSCHPGGCRHSVAALGGAHRGADRRVRLL